MSAELEVCVGKRRIGVPLARHWAVKVGDLWYELEGAAISDYNAANTVNVHGRDEDYEQIERKKAKFHASHAEVQQWAQEWLLSHPTYKINGDNCQLFVNEFLAHFLPEEPREETQNVTFGSTLAQVGTVAVKAGAIVTAVGVGAVVLGKLVQGSHSPQEQKKKEST